MEGGADGVPQLSAGSVLGAAVTPALYGQPLGFVAMEVQWQGPYVLQVLRLTPSAWPTPSATAARLQCQVCEAVLRQTPTAWPYALSDGCHYWWCNGQSPETLPHGAVVQCETLLLWNPPPLQLLHGPVAVVGRPVCAERCPEVASFAEVSPGSEQQELRLEGLEQAGGALDMAVVPDSILRLLRTCADWSTTHAANGTAESVPLDLCKLLSPNYAVKDTGFGNIVKCLFHRGSIAPATGPAVMAGMLGLPEATLNWRTRKEISYFIASVLSTAASWLSGNRLEPSLAFDWEEDPPISIDWIAAKRLLKAISTHEDIWVHGNMASLMQDMRLPDTQEQMKLLAQT
eukprot:m51a1_g4870 hypothetical protein (345) ;mRNA; r:361945-364744